MSAAAPGLRGILDELERASLELDALIDDTNHGRREARKLEDIEERARAIAGRLMLAVRGREAMAAMAASISSNLEASSAHQTSRPGRTA